MNPLNGRHYTREQIKKALQNTMFMVKATVNEKIAGFKVEYDRPENKFAFISLGEIQFNVKWTKQSCLDLY